MAAEPVRTGEGSAPKLTPQRVTATVQREARRLVRLETEHETLLTTPEHPFATPGSGWVSAGRLAPGDWVVSERLGAVRLLSVRSEPTARPVPVFNLSVAASHAYFVGTARVLVHNTNCRPNTAESREAALERLLRRRDEINREIEGLTKTAPKSREITESKARRKKLQMQIDALRKAQRREQQKEEGVVPLKTEEQVRQHFETDHRAAQEALAEAQKELTDLERRPPTSEHERVAFEARRRELNKRLPELTFSADRTHRILALLHQLEELEKAPPALDTDRRTLEETKKELRSVLRVERKRHRNLKFLRKKRTDPDWRRESTEYKRNQKRRLLQLRSYLADTERPRDPLELLEDELASRHLEPPSEGRDARIHHLTDQIETKKKMIALRRKYHAAIGRRRCPRLAREKLIAQGQDTSQVDREIEQANRELQAIRLEAAQLRIREGLLAKLEGTPWTHAPGSVDDSQLHEFERRLAESIATGAENVQQLSDIEHVLDGMDLSESDWPDAILDEAYDLDQVLHEQHEQEELTRQQLSPERAGLQASRERLQQELREERAAVEAAVSALANEHAHLQITQAGSSSGPTWQERLRAIQERQRELRAHWRARLQARLDSAQAQLSLMLRFERFSDDAIEAELAQEIALLERELQSSSG